MLPLTGKAMAKRGRRGSSVRTLPLHDEIIRQGFIDYAHSLPHPTLTPRAVGERLTPAAIRLCESPQRTRLQ
jgi:hypothetical protein